MPRQTEPNANNALGSLLQDMLPRSQVRSENTQAISGHPGLRPDIIVAAPGRSPVVVEAEYMPARTVEPEARSRLGLEVATNGRIIEAAIALRYPDSVSEAHNLPAALSSARLDYCVFTEGATAVHRFPESGWLEGAVEDLADMVRPGPPARRRAPPPAHRAARMSSPAAPAAGGPAPQRGCTR